MIKRVIELNEIKELKHLGINRDRKELKRDIEAKVETRKNRKETKKELNRNIRTRMTKSERES